MSLNKSHQLIIPRKGFLNDIVPNMAKKNDFGDWQTNMYLATEVCKYLKIKGVNPKIIIEPTCGKGNFIVAALSTFENIECVYGIEINNMYLMETDQQIHRFYNENSTKKQASIKLYNQSIFDFDFSQLQINETDEILIVGNPPWVTNSHIGVVNGKNIPGKRNFMAYKGIDAITGKSNFDIAEYILLKLLKFAMYKNAYISLLIKTSVIKNLVYMQKKARFPIANIEQLNIDAKKEFGACVSAALLIVDFGKNVTDGCTVKDFYTHNELRKFGWIKDSFVADKKLYEKYQNIDGRSRIQWRSGIKHDCSKIMELDYKDGIYSNGYGKIVDIEPDLIYPLLKSSDIQRGAGTINKYVIITQFHSSDGTDWIKERLPKTYAYLQGYAELFESRKSLIYKNRPRFSMFGIGDYSFKEYKVVISGLYKTFKFLIVPPHNKKPVMVDDTCYFVGFDDYESASAVSFILNSLPISEFISSLVFMDSKRVITKDVLMRLDLCKIIQNKILQYVNLTDKQWNCINRICNNMGTDQSVNISLFDDI